MPFYYRKEPFPEKLFRESGTIEFDMDYFTSGWLDVEFPSFEHFKYHRPILEFSQYLEGELNNVKS